LADLSRHDPLPGPNVINAPRQEPAANPANLQRQPPGANSGWANPLRQEPPPNAVWSDVVMVPPNGDNSEAPVQSVGEESDYHQNWPIMVEQPDKKKHGRGLLLILILLLVMAGGAAVSFFMFRDKFFGSRGGPAVSGPGNPGKPAVTADPKPTSAAVQAGVKPPTPGPSQSPQPTASGQVAAPGDSGKPQQTAQATPTPTPQAASTPQATQSPQSVAGAKLTSLQVASFPNEGSAKQFQDRLVKAGLPAYVVAADIPHRGKWFRVRAGKFASQEEAHQAAESWRKQAAAAGINLQLVPCEYQ
jgi:cell division septation protein DedD